MRIADCGLVAPNASRSSSEPSAMAPRLRPVWRKKVRRVMARAWTSFESIVILSNYTSAATLQRHRHGRHLPRDTIPACMQEKKRVRVKYDDVLDALRQIKVRTD